MEKDKLLMFELSRLAKGFEVSKESRLFETFMFSHREHFQTAIPAEESPSLS